MKMTTSLSPHEHLSILKTSIEVQLPFSVMRPSNLPLLKKGRDIRNRANSQHTRLPHHVALLLGVPCLDYDASLPSADVSVVLKKGGVLRYGASLDFSRHDEGKLNM